MHLIQPAAAAASPWSSRTRSEASDAGVLACAAMIAARPRDTHRVLVIGGAEARARAAAMGILASGGIAPTLGRAAAAARAVHAVISAATEPDAVFGWSPGCDGVLESLDGLRVTRLLVDPAAGAGRHWAGRGDSGTPIDLPSPAAWFAGGSIEAAAPVNPPRIGLLGDPPGGTDIGLLAGVVSLLRVAGVRGVAGIADRMNPGWRRARRLEAEMLGAGCFHAPEVPSLVTLQPGGYAVIDEGSSPYTRGMLAAWAAARGVLPVAGDDGEHIGTVLPRELIAPGSDAPSLARLLLALIEDHGLRERAWAALSETSVKLSGGLAAWCDDQLGESVAAAATEAQTS